MSGQKIAIVDYGAGNLNSVKKAFDYLGAVVVVTTQPETVAAADKIVLPGVGHFKALEWPRQHRLARRRAARRECREAIPRDLPGNAVAVRGQ